VQFTDLRPLMLAQDRRTLLKVSSVEDQTVTAQVLLDGGEPLDRTTVRRYTAEQVVRWRSPSEQILNRYEDATGQRAEQ
jgi:hypothetical protein